MGGPATHIMHPACPPPRTPANSSPHPQPHPVLPACLCSMEALGNQGEVHRGFVTYAMALEPNITKLLQAANDRAAAANTTTRLWLTGHRWGAGWGGWWGAINAIIAAQLPASCNVALHAGASNPGCSRWPAQGPTS